MMVKVSRTRARVLAAAGMAAVASAVGGVTFQASAAEVGRPGIPVPPVPDAIKVPDGSTVIGTFRVTTGVQTYTCVVPADATTGAYTGPSVPEARLAGAGGTIHHFGGPSWQSNRDGSLVTATVEARSPRAGTIPELRLKVASHSGSGLLDRADYISRLATSGGLAPAGACAAGETVSVRYGAIYVFWDAPAPG